jgi:hypothetical protein
MAKIFDKDDWIQLRCEQIADIQYDRAFESLTEETQTRIWNEAEQEYCEREVQINEEE